MKSKFPVLGMVVFGFLFPALPSFAHHSYSAEFQTEKEFTVTGVLSKIDWTNPHIYFYVDAKDDAGNVVTWAFEGYPPNMLHRHGLTRAMFKIGEMVTVTGVPPKDGSKHLGYGKRLKYLSDGRLIDMWVTDRAEREKEQ